MPPRPSTPRRVGSSERSRRNTAWCVDSPKAKVSRRTMFQAISRRSSTSGTRAWRHLPTSVSRSVSTSFSRGLKLASDFLVPLRLLLREGV